MVSYNKDIFFSQLWQVRNYHIEERMRPDERSSRPIDSTKYGGALAQIAENKETTQARKALKYGDKVNKISQLPKLQLHAKLEFFTRKMNFICETRIFIE